jgi:hypothetical protein
MITPSKTGYSFLPVSRSFINVLSDRTNEDFLATAATVPALIAPMNATGQFTRRPSFDWSEVVGATQYNIQISKNAAFSTTITNVTLAASAYMPATDLPAGMQLFWRVRSKAGTVFGGWSLVWSFTTPNPPSAPVLSSPAKNALLTDYTPRLDWGNSTVPLTRTFDHYQLQLATDPAFLSISLDRNTVGGLTASEYTIPDPDRLPPNTTFYWRVRSWNTLGEYSNWAASRSFRTAIQPPTLQAPGDTTHILTLKPVFDWADMAGATKYKIQVSKTATFGSSLVNLTVTPSTYTPLANLPAGLTLYWRVQALGTNGPSAWSTPWSFVTP